MTTLLLKAIQNAAVHIGATYLYMAIGHGTTAESISQNGCISEDQRVATTNTIVTTTNASDTSQHSGSFTISGATLALTEACVMTAAVAGDGAARSKFDVLNLIQNDVIVLVFKFVVS
jgi:hypothetical protein